MRCFALVVCLLASVQGPPTATAEPQTPPLALRWVSSQVDVDARIAGNTDEAQLSVAAAYSWVSGRPVADADGRAAGFRFALGVAGEAGSVSSNRCKLAVDCFIVRAGPSLQLEWSAGDVRRQHVSSDRAYFVRLVPHAAWVDAGREDDGFEIGASLGLGAAFSITKKGLTLAASTKTIMTLQALATVERGTWLLGVGFGLSLR